MKQEIKINIFSKHCKFFEEYLNEYLKVNKYENENDKRILADIHRISRFCTKTANIFNTYDDIFKIHKQLELFSEDYWKLVNRENRIIYKYFARSLEETIYYIEDYIGSLLD